MTTSHLPYTACVFFFVPSLLSSIFPSIHPSWASRESEDEGKLFSYRCFASRTRRYICHLVLCENRMPRFCCHRNQSQTNLICCCWKQTEQQTLGLFCCFSPGGGVLTVCLTVFAIFQGVFTDRMEKWSSGKSGSVFIKEARCLIISSAAVH